jgi:hypothetical protein
MTVEQSGGDGGVTTGDLTVLTDPLNGCSTLVLGEAELLQIQMLPRGDAG